MRTVYSDSSTSPKQVFDRSLAHLPERGRSTKRAGLWPGARAENARSPDMAELKAQYGPSPLPAPQPVPEGYHVAPPPPRPLLLFITNVKNARTVWVEISINDNVHMLKRYTSRKMGIPVEDMILVYQGEELKTETQIKQSKLDFVIQKAAESEPSAEDCTIHLIDIKDTPGDIREPKKEMDATHGSF
ncbi:unnamed protein product [Effrenium voratum]|nr:unnamed protein product [Effrenium voratum]